MLVRIRLTVPDRPGSLGMVASTVGGAGADVVQVEVLSTEAGRAVDDVHVDVRNTDHLDRLARALGALVGVTVDGVVHDPPPVTGHAELELVARLMAAPSRALATLVDGVPAAIGADWAIVLGTSDGPGLDTVVLAGGRAPDPSSVPSLSLGLPLRLGTPRLAPSGGPAFGGTVVAPLGVAPVALVAVREKGPAFHRSEMWRLAEIGTIAGHVLEATPDLVS